MKLRYQMVRRKKILNLNKTTSADHKSIFKKIRCYFLNTLVILVILLCLPISSVWASDFGVLLCKNDCGDVPTSTGQSPDNGLHVDVNSGSVGLSNSSGELTVNAGQFGYVSESSAPPAIVPRDQGVQVTMPSSSERSSDDAQSSVPKNGSSSDARLLSADTETNSVFNNACNP